jgi:hypothetical protein
MGINNSISVRVNNQQDYKVKTVNLQSVRLQNLVDVSSVNPQDGDTLVYNATTQLYEAKQINLDFGEY